ncbi:MAG TPA: hypothetical protein VE173_03890, partial [Longimicrobiales bacterium]|nr:hypothetical protein [Longimicrobiales bacterium]
MTSERTLVYFGPGQTAPPDLIQRFSEDHSLRLVDATSAADVQSLMNRAFPACLVLDAAGNPGQALEVCGALKKDA